MEKMDSILFANSKHSSMHGDCVYIMAPIPATPKVEKEYDDHFPERPDVKSTVLNRQNSLGNKQELHGPGSDITPHGESNVCEAYDEMVDILENGEGNIRLSPSADTTECSTSSGNATSSDYCSLFSLSDAEVESDNSNIDDSRFLMRKKILTADWKKYRAPLMWRCHWLELRMKELQFQAAKYDKLLLAIEQKKQLKYGHATSDGSAAGVVPYSGHCFQTKIKKKRRQPDNTVDIQLYMSSHPVFSYYEKKKKADNDCLDEDGSIPVITEESKNNIPEEFGVTNDWLLSERVDADGSPEKLLWKIEGLQSRILKLKTQLNKLILKNATKTSVVENSGQCIAEMTSSVRSPPLSPAQGDRKLAEGLYAPCQQLSDYEGEDLFMPGTAISSYVEPPMLDFDGHGKGLFSLAGLPIDEAAMGGGDSCGDIFDEVLIDNQAAEEDLHNYEVCQPFEKPYEGIKVEDGKHDIVLVGSAKEPSDPRPFVVKEEEEKEKDSRPTSLPESSGLKLCLLSDVHVPKNKRNRRRAPGCWNGENSVAGADQDS